MSQLRMDFRWGIYRVGLLKEVTAGYFLLAWYAHARTWDLPAASPQLSICRSGESARHVVSSCLATHAQAAGGGVVLQVCWRRFFH